MKASLNKTRQAALICVVALIALSFGGIYAVSAQEDKGASVDAEEWGFFAMKCRGMPFGKMMGWETVVIE